ncbi:MAG: DUF1289 domain-containing protein [Ruminococcus sp.]|nr:DUF1289 domain-containing protein [Ruminococcus sp.]
MVRRYERNRLPQLFVLIFHQGCRLCRQKYCQLCHRFNTEICAWHEFPAHEK